MSYLMIVGSRQNREYISNLTNELLKWGFNVWVDDIRVGYGDEWWNPTVEALKQAVGVIIIMTPDGQASEWVNRQAQIALKLGKPLIPLLLRGEEWPLFFSFQYIDVRETGLPPESFFRYLTKLVHPQQQKGQIVSFDTITSESANTQKQNNTYKVFISYRRDDSADVSGRIYDRLVKKFKKSAVFKDVDSIPLGVDFREHIAGFIKQSHVLIAVIGVNWINVLDKEGNNRLNDPNDFVRIELEMAFQHNLLVIPVLVNDAVMPGEEELPNSLKKLPYLNAAQVRRDPDFSRDMSYVIASVQKHFKKE